MGYDLIGVSELGEKCGSSDNLYILVITYIY